MKDFDPQWVRRREQQRVAATQFIARGKARYIWLNGVLGWGGTMFVVMSAWEFCRKASPLHGPHFLRQLFVNQLIFGTGGFVFGWWMWRRIKRLANE
jgi:hypothetical protein